MDRFDNTSYWIGVVLLFVIGFLALGGCSSPLSDASFSLQQKFHGAVTSFGFVAQDFTAKATIMADKKHSIQRRLQALELAAMYDRHKDADGNLVLTPEDFTDLTISVAEAQSAIATSQSRWLSLHEKFSESIRLLGTVNTTSMETAKVIHETEQSVQAFTRQVTQALGGILAAASVAF